MRKFEIVATDGAIGSVADMLVDDERWVVRYLGEAVKEAPPYNRAEHADRQWEAACYERLGRPGYWLTSNQARKIKRAQAYLRPEGGPQPTG